MNEKQQKVAKKFINQNLDTKNSEFAGHTDPFLPTLLHSRLATVKAIVKHVSGFRMPALMVKQHEYKSPKLFDLVYCQYKNPKRRGSSKGNQVLLLAL